MTIVTTPEILEPGYLQAYDQRDFTTIAAGVGPRGEDVLRLNQTSDGSETQSLWQTLNVDSHLWPARPANNAVSFWINRRAAFAGTTISGSASTTTASITYPNNGGYLMALGAGNQDRGNFTANSGISWGIVAGNTDDLWYTVQYRSGGDTDWGHWFVKVGDLPLNQWAFVVVNASEMNAGIGASSPTNGVTTTYLNGIKSVTAQPTHSSSSGGSWVGHQMNFSDLSVMRFAIGTPSLAASAIKATSNGPICDLAHLTFHNRQLTDFEVLNLYEAMLYGA